MSGYYTNSIGCTKRDCILCNDYPCSIVAHKPEPDEVAESDRTSGSLTASRSENQ